MIPVALQPEPAYFDEKIRQPGNAWLTGKGMALTAALPPRTKPPRYWRHCLADLHQAYAGICAFLAVYIERAVGATSVDHFVAKSSVAGKAYEWDNYRLACMAMNVHKREFDDVIDPIGLPPNLFFLELATGRIFVNPAVVGPLAVRATATIDRLKLDNGVNRELRQRHFDQYLELLPDHRALALERLQKYSPFVGSEVQRQGL